VTLVRRTILTAALLALGACAAQDDARVQQLLNQRGFGGRTSGNAAEQYYLGIGDSIALIPADDAHRIAVPARLQVRLDGMVDLGNYGGEVYVAGISIPDVEALLSDRLRKYISTIQLDVQLLQSVGKFYYVDGEVRGRGKKRFNGEETVFSVVYEANPTILADEDGVLLIRADPYHPLRMVVDYDYILTGGWSLRNPPVQENDIIYVPPNTLGQLAKILEGLLAPVSRAFAGLLSLSRLIALTDTFGNQDLLYRGGRNRFGGVGFGGYVEESLWAEPGDR